MTIFSWKQIKKYKNYSTRAKYVSSCCYEKFFKKKNWVLVCTKCGFAAQKIENFSWYVICK